MSRLRAGPSAITNTTRISLVMDSSHRDMPTAKSGGEIPGDENPGNGVRDTDGEGDADVK